jgi:DNA ligase (NAD+)
VTPEQLAQIDGVGPIMAESIAAWFAQPHNVALLDRLVARGLAPTMPQAADVAQTLVGMQIVVTGNVPNYTRDSVEAAITDRGGKSPGSVSKNTTAVVVGDKPGASKLTKATELGIPMLTPEQFEQLLETGVLPSAD